MARRNIELSDSSRDDLQHFREEFAAELKLYQRSERQFALPILIILLTGSAALVGSIMLFKPPDVLLFAAGLVIIAVGLVLMAAAATVFQRKLTCPGCHHPFLSEMDECCPQCGAPGLEKRSKRVWHCEFCKTKLRTGKYRNFKYKACTHCGVLLDEKGL